MTRRNPRTYRARRRSGSVTSRNGGRKSRRAAGAASQKELVFTQGAFASMLATVGSERSESGGILLGSRDDFVVRKYVHDTVGSRGRASYDPDIDFLNEAVEHFWNEHGLAFLGFIHSHPRGVSMLSGDYGDGIGDLGYIERIMDVMPGLDRFLAPILYSTYDDGPLRIYPYVAERGAIRDYYATPQGVRIVDASTLTPLMPPEPEPEPEPEYEVEPDLNTEEVGN